MMDIRSPWIERWLLAARSRSSFAIRSGTFLMDRFTGNGQPSMGVPIWSHFRSDPGPVKRASPSLQASYLYLAFCPFSRLLQRASSSHGGKYETDFHTFIQAPAVPCGFHIRPHFNHAATAQSP